MHCGTLRPIAPSRKLRLDGCAEGPTMHNPKVAGLCYLIAVGFIFVVAFHSSAKLLIAGDVPAAVSGVK